MCIHGLVIVLVDLVLIDSQQVECYVIRITLNGIGKVLYLKRCIRLLYELQRKSEPS